MARATGWVLWLCCCAALCLPACTHRSTVDGQDAGVTTDVYPYDGHIVLPDATYGDGSIESFCRAGTALPLKLYRDGAKLMTLALPGGVKTYPVTNYQAGLPESTVALEWGDVAGLALVRAAQDTHGAPAEELKLILNTFASDLGKLGTVTSQTSGTPGDNHDGTWQKKTNLFYPHSDIKEASWLVTVPPSEKQGLDIGWLRNQLMSSILGVDLTALKGAPSGTRPRSRQILVKLSLVKRTSILTGSLIAVSAAVVDQQRYQNDLSDTFARADDLGNGTALSGDGAATSPVCDSTFISRIPKADIVWVVDESDSMNDNRQDIVNNAGAFFARALAAGLDFRMAVTGMRQPDVKKSVTAGKLCSLASNNPGHDGGADRFLRHTEKAAFVGCVKNPPYDFGLYTVHGGKEYGLTNAKAAVKDMLPAVAKSPSRVRPDAELAVIIVTDEAPCELKNQPCTGQKGECDWACKGGFLEPNDYDSYFNKKCALTSDLDSPLRKTMAPYETFFKDAGATVHLIGGGCRSACRANLMWGYQDLVAATKGQTGDVCQKNLGATLQHIVDGIAAAASPVKLKHTPISSTLVVELQTKKLNRSRHHGFMYNAASRSLTFNHVEYKLGHQAVAAYSRFVAAK